MCITPVHRLHTHSLIHPTNHLSHIFIHFPSHPFHLSINPFNYSSVQASSDIDPQSSIYPPIHLSIQPSIQPIIYIYLHIPTDPFTTPPSKKLSALQILRDTNNKDRDDYKTAKYDKDIRTREQFNTRLTQAIRMSSTIWSPCIAAIIMGV